MTLSRKTKIKLYLQMKRTRMIENEISSRYSDQQMRCPIHLSIGQEAIAVGVCSNLTKKDKIVNKLELVSRQEFEILKKIVQKQDATIKKILKKKKLKR